MKVAQRTQTNELRKVYDKKIACISRQSEIVFLQIMMLYIQPLAALSWGHLTVQYVPT